MAKPMKSQNRPRLFPPQISVKEALKVIEGAAEHSTGGIIRGNPLVKESVKEALSKAWNVHDTLGVVMIPSRYQDGGKEEMELAKIADKIIDLVKVVNVAMAALARIPFQPQTVLTAKQYQHELLSAATMLVEYAPGLLKNTKCDTRRILNSVVGIDNDLMSSPSTFLSGCNTEVCHRTAALNALYCVCKKLEGQAEACESWDGRFDEVVDIFSNIEERRKCISDIACTRLVGVIDEFLFRDDELFNRQFGPDMYCKVFEMLQSVDKYGQPAQRVWAQKLGQAIYLLGGAKKPWSTHDARMENNGDANIPDFVVVEPNQPHWSESLSQAEIAAVAHGLVNSTPKRKAERMAYS